LPLLLGTATSILKKLVFLFGGVGTQFADPKTKLALTGCISSYGMTLRL
tara:strand:+ start:435 stop:581 length:147 start_codon:yes stop_codon:yes gene_type:complete